MTAPIPRFHPCHAGTLGRNGRCVTVSVRRSALPVRGRVQEPGIPGVEPLSAAGAGPATSRRPAVPGRALPGPGGHRRSWACPAPAAASPRRCGAGCCGPTGVRPTPGPGPAPVARPGGRPAAPAHRRRRRRSAPGGPTRARTATPRPSSPPPGRASPARRHPISSQADPHGTCRPAGRPRRTAAPWSACGLGTRGSGHTLRRSCTPGRRPERGVGRDEEGARWCGR